MKKLLLIWTILSGIGIGITLFGIWPLAINEKLTMLLVLPAYLIIQWWLGIAAVLIFSGSGNTDPNPLL